MGDKVYPFEAEMHVVPGPSGDTAPTHGVVQNGGDKPSAEGRRGQQRGLWGSTTKRSVNAQKRSSSAFFKRSKSIFSQSVAPEIQPKEKGAYQGDKRWWILHVDSDFANTWELVMAFAMVYVSLITPFEVGFIETKSSLTQEMKSPWFALNRTLEIIFTMDICVQFIRAYRDEDEVLIHHPRKIAKRYLKTWFFLDFVSTVPFDIIVGQWLGGEGNEARALKLMRVLRLIRLLKLARLLKGLAMFRRFGVAYSLDYNMLEVLKFLLITLLYAHWMACLMGITTNMQDTSASFLLPHYDGRGFSTYEDLREGVEPTNLYMSSLYWSIMTITTIGYGDITPETEAEQLMSCACMMLGAFHFGYVIGTVGSILNTRNKKRHQFREKVNNLNNFMEEFKFHGPVQKELRQYLHYQATNVDITEYQSLLASMSPNLRGLVTMRINSKWIRRLRVFHGAPASFFYDLSAALEQVVYPPTEEIITQGAVQHTMHILIRGLCSVAGINGSRVRGGGEIFGSLCLYKETVSVTRVESITYTTFFSIPREKAAGVLEKYPDLQAKFRRHAIHTLFYEELISFKNACAIQEERRKLASMGEPDRERERSRRKLAVQQSRKSFASAASGYNSKEEKLENASLHPRVQWYLRKLEIQRLCEDNRLEHNVVNMQRQWRRYYYKRIATGTLRSMQAPTPDMVPKMLLTLTQLISNLRRYMEDAGLIKADNSPEVLAIVAGRSFKRYNGTQGVQSSKEKSKMKNELVNALTSIQSLGGASGAAFTALTSGAAITSSAIATPAKAAPSLGGGGGGLVDGKPSGQLSVSQFEELKRELRTIVREELRAMKE